MNLLGGQKAFVIAHASEISAARRHGAQLAEALHFNEIEAGRLAIIVTEAATNLLKHAQEGLLFLNAIRSNGSMGVAVLAVDRGPGIGDLEQSLRDGISTTGTSGTGLGAMRRQADEFDAYSQPGNGSIFYMCVKHQERQEKQDGSTDSNHASPDLLEIAGICQPIAGEEECGDAWEFSLRPDGATVLVADGLGHGPEAARASRAAVETLQRRAHLQPPALLEAMHEALRGTRGAAAAVTDIRIGSGELRFAGIGNISARVILGETSKQLVSHNGIVGHNMRKVQEFGHPWHSDALYVMCSDGITTQWNLDAYPGLAARHPALIAGVIYRDFTRGRDDATVVVVKQKAGV